MKCREGCEGEKAQHSVLCEACWMRLPLEEKDALGDAWVRGRGVQKAEQRALDWLAADDKRRAE